MPKKFEKKEVLPDPLYNDLLAGKFINYLMERGKKNTARKILYGSFEIIKEKTKQEPLDVFRKAIDNVAPLLEVKPKRVGGATYQVPREVKGERRISLAARWIISAAKNKKGSPMRKRLAEELISAFNNTGPAIKKKEDSHRMAEANRAFAHFSW
jgi:small subunit ribosomal protein S7